MYGARINRGEGYSGLDVLEAIDGLDSYTVTLQIFGLPEPEVLHFFAEDADHALEQALDHVGDLEVWPVVSSHVEKEI